MILDLACTKLHLQYNTHTHTHTVLWKRKQGKNKDERSRERKHRNKFACLFSALFCVLSTLIQVKERKRKKRREREREREARTVRQTHGRHSMTNKTSTKYTETRKWKKDPAPALLKVKCGNNNAVGWSSDLQYQM